MEYLVLFVIYAAEYAVNCSRHIYEYITIDICVINICDNLYYNDLYIVQNLSRAPGTEYNVYILDEIYKQQIGIKKTVYALTGLGSIIIVICNCVINYNYSVIVIVIEK